MCEVKKESKLFACCNDFISYQNEKMQTRDGNSVDLTEFKNKNILTLVCCKEELYYLENTETGILFGCKTNLNQIKTKLFSISNDIFVDKEYFQKFASIIRKNYPGISYNNVLKYFIALRLDYIDENFIKDNEQFVSLIISKTLIGLCKNGDLKLIDYSDKEKNGTEINVKVAEKVNRLITANYNYDFYGILIVFDKIIKVYDVYKNYYYEFRKENKIKINNVKDGVLSSDGKYVVLLFDDGKARLYKQKISDKGIFYGETVCDLLKKLTEICDIAINNNDVVGLLDNKNNLNKLNLKAEIGGVY